MKYYYHSRYNEFWKDIELMIEENYVDDSNENSCVVFSSNLLSEIYHQKVTIPNHNKKIAYQLEPLISNHWFNMNEIVEWLKYYDEVWDYDLHNIKVLKENGIDAKYRPFLYSENLKRIKNKEEPDIDILFYGTMNEYRQNILSNLIGYHLFYKINFVNVVNVTGILLDELISRSKIILDLSTDNLNKKIQKQSRIYYALINDKCVISEKSDMNYFGDLITEVDINHNLQGLAYVISDYLFNEKWKNYSDVSEKFKVRSLFFKEFN